MNNKTPPLMPKATAVWLIENTSLTFDQIADFCCMHPLEVQGIADGEVANGIIGFDPIANSQLTAENIKKCEENPNARLHLSEKALKHVEAKRKKSTKYTPVARRQDKPDAIAWLLKNYPTIKDTQIVKLIGTTKSTIQSVKERTHWNANNIRPRDPVLLGLCKQTELDSMLGNTPRDASE
ncbi:MAG: DUF1013 domain-containing protein [Alphaproteobacteria bacterium]|nr:DUF1013 domain-containing protein [Alphaproteobacteria bacterium]OJV13509.1 MAG: cytoplasmic protein [Alphaproteobacteria bacterium 33-17]